MQLVGREARRGPASTRALGVRCELCSAQEFLTFWRLSCFNALCATRSLACASGLWRQCTSALLALVCWRSRSCVLSVIQGF